MDSFTMTFTGVKSELQASFFPPIELNGNYVIGLVDFQSYNAIFNVKEPLNSVTYYNVNKITTPKGTVTIDALNKALEGKVVLKMDGKENILPKLLGKVLTNRGLMLKLNKHKGKQITVNEGEDVYFYDQTSPITFTIPEGTYEVIDIAREIQRQVPDFVLTADNKTMKATLLSSQVFDFTKPCLGSVLLGFRGLSTSKTAFTSTNKININNVNVIRVKCNIANGSYLNGKKSHTIHSFYPEAPPGYKIIEVPKNIIYFPVNQRILDVVSITFADQNDRPIDFNGEETTNTCHIKKI